MKLNVLETEIGSSFGKIYGLSGSVKTALTVLSRGIVCATVLAHLFALLFSLFVATHIDERAVLR